MLKLSKKMEYAIMAMQYFASNQGMIIPAKEIAEKYDISFEFLSKTLQVMLKSGFVKSQKGINGGYELAHDPKEITIGDIVFAIDGQSAIVQCMDEEGKDKDCDRMDSCTIRNPIKVIQTKINDVFNETTLADICDLEEMDKLNSDKELLQIEKG
jgi:Rrf2 family transcriptional regulator, cysteine metabolism repressor